ncbi:hypothetical protein Taro_040162 [Colocasia esculenta]|uniref:Strictosidine synthase conserved region domain-containing protein n=1 Tax=Colocasia esculenta TaxID=4460 RepID=A0A843WXP8_COLES|nr:hypothetical protein [Colocasia esculenta]
MCACSSDVMLAVQQQLTYSPPSPCTQDVCCTVLSSFLMHRGTSLHHPIKNLSIYRSASARSIAFPHFDPFQPDQVLWMGIRANFGNGGGTRHRLLHCLLSAVAVAVVFLDPFRLGPLGRHDYRPVKHYPAPYREVMAGWPRDHRSRLRMGRREFAGDVDGPESLEFDLEGRGPYTGLADGRVVRWMGEGAGWETFALVTANWSEEACANGVNSTKAKQHGDEELCGRPLGLRFDRSTGDLYIADAYRGLMVVGRDGGVATPLATHAQGERILFANDLDLHGNGSIFFTDTSTRYNRRDHFMILLEGEATGRLLRLMRYWLEGPAAGKVEVFADLPGFPDNVRANGEGHRYWVAIDCCRTRAEEFLSQRPWLRAIYFRLPLKLGVLARLVGMDMYTVVSLLDGDGKVVEVLEDRRGEVAKLVSEVREVEGKLWLGTVAHNHIVTIPYPPYLRAGHDELKKVNA